MTSGRPSTIGGVKKVRDDGLVKVRATVHLQGLHVGQEALVDPTKPNIADLLAGQFLVLVHKE